MTTIDMFIILGAATTVAYVLFRAGRKR